MKNKIRILLLEDSAADAELAEIELHRSGLEFSLHRADTKESFVRALDEFLPDIVLADYNLPMFNGFEALDCVLTRGADIPFILVSGTIGEDLAVDAVKRGATDYILKQNLSRLVTSVRRALADAENRRKTREAQARLRESEATFRSIFETAPSLILTIDGQGTILTCNRRIDAYLGHEARDVIGRRITDFVVPEHLSKAEEFLREVNTEGGSRNKECRMIRKDGTEIEVNANSAILDPGIEKPSRTVCIINDVTDFKAAEKAMRESERMLSEAEKIAGIGSWSLDLSTGALRWSSEMFRLFGIEPSEFDGSMEVALRNIHPDDRAAVEASNRSVFVDKKPRPLECRILIPGGGERIVYMEGRFELDARGEPVRLVGFVQDITERKRVENEIRHLASFPERNINPIVETDIDGNVTYANPAAKSFFPDLEALGREHPWFGNFEHVVGKLDRNEESVVVRDVRIGNDYHQQIINYIADRDAIRIYSINITERKRAETARRENEERLSLLFMSAAEGIVFFSADGIVIDVNPKFTGITGFAAGELKGKSLLHVLSMLQIADAAVIDGFRKIMTGAREIPRFEWNITNVRGEKVILDVSASAIEKDGKTIAFSLFASDVTEKQWVEKMLVQSEKRYRTLFESARFGILLLDFDTFAIVDANPSVAETLGYRPDALQGKKIRDLGLFTDENDFENMRSALRKHSYIRFDDLKAVCENGQVIDVEFSANPIVIDDRTIIQCSIMNITERVITQNALHEKTEELDRFFTVALDLLCIADIDGRFRILNRAWETTLGYSTDELTGRSFLDFVHPDDIGMARDTLAVLSSRSEVNGFSNRFVRKDGSYRWIEWRMASDGSRIYAAARDITGRILAEEDLRNSAREISDLYNNSPCGYHSLGPDGTVLLINDTELEWLGYAREEIVGKKNFRDLLLDADVWSFDANFMVLRRDGWIANAEYRLARKDGTILPVLYNETAIFDEDGVFVMSRSTMIDDTERRKAEESRRQTEERFQRIAENARDMIYRISLPEGRYEYVSPASFEIFGYPPEDWYADSGFLEKIIHPDWAEYCRYSWNNLLSGELAPYYEMQVIHETGGARWINMRSVIVLDDRGNAVAIEGLITDITLRKNAEESLRMSEERYKELFNNISSGVAIYEAVEGGKDFILKDFNKSGERIDGDRKPDIVGKSIREFRPGAEEYGLLDVLERVWKSGVPEHIPAKRYTDDRLDSWYENFVYRLPSGEIVAVFDNVTDRKLAEEKLVSYHDHLEELVRERTIEFETANENLHREIRVRQEVEEQLVRARQEAEEANRAKSVFLSNMSHEIRTPLNSILGFSEILMRDAGLTDRHREWLSTINRSGAHLLTLINDILEISKIEAGKTPLNTEPIDFIAFLVEMEKMFSFRASSKGISFSLRIEDGVPGSIRIDAGKLRQIFINLLENAVKFTDEGSISLRVGARDEEGGKFAFEVLIEDTGSGIAESDYERIFTTFGQAEAGIRRGGGTGLGLAISREYAHMLGGGLTVESEPGKGSCFRFEFEAEVSEEPPAAMTGPRGSVKGIKNRGTTHRILVVDDVFENRKLLEELLGSIGFLVDEAADGEEALKKFESFQPHAILLDMRLPRMNGYDVIRRIKSTERGFRTPVIAVTASAFHEDRTRILDAGANGYIRKPFKEAEILDVLSLALGVEYEYADGNAGGKTIDGGEPYQLPREKLSESEVRSILHAARGLEFDELLRAIGETAVTAPVTAARLRDLANKFDYNEIVKLLEKLNVSE